MTTINIALTGAMGCGKSAAASIFKGLGAEVVDLDKLCKELLSNDAEIRAKTSRLLGAEVFDPSGNPNACLIAQKVFSDKELLLEYEAIIHPAALKKAGIDIFCCGSVAAGCERSGANTSKTSPKRIRIFEIPLLYEKRLDKYFEICVSILCSEALRLSRLRARGMSANEISARDAFQMSAEKKAEMADVVLFNEGSVPFLKRQANLFLSRI